MNIPPFLKKGDKVAVVCPAGYIKNDLTEAYKVLESWGLEVMVGASVLARSDQFAGNDQLRTQDVQQALDNPDVKAIICGRGGYGSVRIVDEIDFSVFQEKPKWFVGFSDITVFHGHIHRQFQVATIHGQMVNSFAGASSASLSMLRDALFGENIDFSYHYTGFPNRSGEATGILVGGNLSILHSLLGSASDFDYDNKILFIEDVGERYHNLDRMLWTLKRAGKLHKLKGLIVGGFTALIDSKPSFGETYQEMIMNKIGMFDFPVAFGCPAGHISDNRALVFGREVRLRINEDKVSVTYI